MASLTGNQINNTYSSLIKTLDNGSIDPITPKQLSDGSGGSLPIEFSQVQTNFLGSVDFSSATVTGLPGNGLVSVYTTTSSTHSGPDGADLVFATLTIPANTFVADDIVNIKVINSQDHTGGGWVYQGLWISNSTTLFSGWKIGGGEDTSKQAKFYDKTGMIVVADGTGAATAFHGADQTATDQQTNGYSDFSDRKVTPINWTSDVYLNLSCFVDNAGSSITNHGIVISKIN